MSFQIFTLAAVMQYLSCRSSFWERKRPARLEEKIDIFAATKLWSDNIEASISILYIKCSLAMMSVWDCCNFGVNRLQAYLLIVEIIHKVCKNVYRASAWNRVHWMSRWDKCKFKSPQISKKCDASSILAFIFSFNRWKFGFIVCLDFMLVRKRPPN